MLKKRKKDKIRRKTIDIGRDSEVIQLCSKNQGLQNKYY